VIDIQVVRLSDVLPITGITAVPGVRPRTVRLTGRDFKNVESVYINGSPSPEFVILSDSEILAQVPADRVQQSITEAYVLSTRISFTSRSLVELSVGTRPQTVEGTLSLVQSFTRMLLRTPGSNIFHRQSGGGLFKNIGKVIGTNARDRVGAEAVVAVARTRQLMIASQTPDRRIPPEERLLTAEIIGLGIQPREGTVTLSVKIDSAAGTAAAATIIR
jgi:hypothetical protein